MVYESIPEETTLYLVDTGEDKQLAQSIIDCHSKFVGYTDDFDGDSADKAREIGTRIYCSSDEDIKPIVMPLGVSRIVVTGFAC